MTQDFVADDLTKLEALLAVYRVHNHVSVHTAEVFGVQDRIVVLTDVFVNSSLLGNLDIGILVQPYR